MKNVTIFMVVLGLTMSLFSMNLFAESSDVQENKITTEDNSAEDELDYDDGESDEFSTVQVKDSMEPLNRKLFKFNDNVYYYGIKPFNKGYATVVPIGARTGVRKFFKNAFFPGRFLNCLFQGKFKGAGTEVTRFVINSSMGLGGFFDVAKYQFELEPQEEDFGQTLAKYGMDNGSYMVIPFLGPSTVRDAIGYIGDTAMNPITFLSLFVTPFASLGNPYNTTNEFSLDEGDLYESVVDAAIDPYIAIQDAYIQNRNKKIEE